MTEFITDAVRELTGPMFRLINRIIGNREEARDLTQDLFVKLLRDPDRIRGELRPYLMQAAYNAALNARRDRIRRDAAHETIRQDDQSPIETGPARDLESAETSRWIGAAVTALPDRQREAITLRFYGDLTLAEIAAAMDISEASVRVHLARGLQNLKSELMPSMDKE